MKRLICCLVLPLCVFVGASRAQEPKQSVIFDVSVIDLDLGNTASVETLMKDKAGLDRLIADGKARLEASLHMRSRLTEQAYVRIGERVPVQMGSATIPAPPPRPGEGSSPVSGVAQIQYENTGLTLNVMPTRVTGDQIEVSFKFEQSGVDRSTGMLTPSFVTRTISEVVQLRTGEPTVLLGVVQHQ